MDEHFKFAVSTQCISSYVLFLSNWLINKTSFFMMKMNYIRHDSFSKRKTWMMCRKSWLDHNTHVYKRSELTKLCET